MDVLTFKRWEILVDRESTRLAYDQIPVGGPDNCECLYCKNFAAARELAYPQEFRALLDRLGIDFRKEVEVWEANETGARIRFYAGWFHFIGEILSVHEPQNPESPRLPNTRVTLKPWDELVRPNFAVSFSGGRDLLDPVFQTPHIVQLDFYCEVPWVLQEDPDP